MWQVLIQYAKCLGLCLQPCSMNYLFQTTSTLQIFIFAMILYPEAQLTAQKELDAVIGPNRLPSFDDRRSLPYVSALCKEVLRWHPLLTIAIPHRLMQDDVIGQYFIPAGTVVIGNSWFVVYHHGVHLVL
jgi:cytochrome P450